MYGLRYVTRHLRLAARPTQLQRSQQDHRRSRCRLHSDARPPAVQVFGRDAGRAALRRPLDHDRAVHGRRGERPLRASPLLGLAHERLTFPYQGLNQRLTGVEPAKVVNKILA